MNLSKNIFERGEKNQQKEKEELIWKMDPSKRLILTFGFVGLLMQILKLEKAHWKETEQNWDKNEAMNEAKDHC